VFNGFGCTGENRSPALLWRDAPAGTRSFAITLYDPDAPTGSGWWHWVVYNIPADVKHLPEDAGHVGGQGLPAGAVQGRTDFGTRAYGGACPPVGAAAHRYVMTVYALKVDHLPVPADASAAMVGFMVHMNQLGAATLQSSYGR
jgi:Raf kinase inhibitor-like YbhB/YbcL family protein